VNLTYHNNQLPLIITHTGSTTSFNISNTGDILNTSLTKLQTATAINDHCLSVALRSGY